MLIKQRKGWEIAKSRVTPEHMFSAVLLWERRRARWRFVGGGGEAEDDRLLAVIRPS